LHINDKLESDSAHGWLSSEETNDARQGSKEEVLSSNESAISTNISRYTKEHQEAETLLENVMHSALI